MSSKPGRRPIPASERFWQKVEKTDNCWNWAGAPNQHGYGRIRTGGRHTLAHRYSWEIHGLGSLDGRTLDHICHNRMCVNPNHLRIVTQAQNNQNFIGAQCRNPTGVRGVTRTRNGRPYKALVVHEGRRYYLGRFTSLADATTAVRDKRLELFTHNEADKASVDTERETNRTNAARRLAA